MSVYLQLEMSTLGVLNVPTVKNLYKLVRATFRLYFEICLRIYIDMNFFPSFSSGKYLLEVVQVFGSGKQRTFKLLICIYFWIIELQILSRSLVGKFQQNPFPSNTSTFNCTPIVGDWSFFLSLKRIAKNLTHFYISSVIVSM